VDSDFVDDEKRAALAAVSPPPPRGVLPRKEAPAATAGDRKKRPATFDDMARAATVSATERTGAGPVADLVATTCKCLVPSLDGCLLAGSRASSEEEEGEEERSGRYLKSYLSKT
jgi:hypothetical protein